ncbi:MAG: hypothetical protein IKH39_01770 [Candidatus Methanomethylophilaceae archaeon]|nr:hypothetical protein [Candidatus Methanomethylophilaceae archaeon]
MLNRDFEEWFFNLKGKIYTTNRLIANNRSAVQHSSRYRLELSLLNTLLRSNDPRSSFIRIASDYPEVCDCVPMLIPGRQKTLELTDVSGTHIHDLSGNRPSVEECVKFMEDTGFFDLISNVHIGDLYIFVMGMEVALQALGTFDYSGIDLCALVEEHISKTGARYQKGLDSSHLRKQYGLDMSPVRDIDFDYVVEGTDCIYGIVSEYRFKNCA